MSKFICQCSYVGMSFSSYHFSKFKFFQDSILSQFILSCQFSNSKHRSDRSCFISILLSMLKLSSNTFDVCLFGSLVIIAIKLSLFLIRNYTRRYLKIVSNSISLTPFKAPYFCFKFLYISSQGERFSFIHQLIMQSNDSISS